MKGSGYSWASSLRKLIIDLVFTICISDGDMWMIVSVDTSKIVSTTDDGLPAGEHYY